MTGKHRFDPAGHVVGPHAWCVECGQREDYEDHEPSRRQLRQPDARTVVAGQTVSCHNTQPSKREPVKPSDMRLKLSSDERKTLELALELVEHDEVSFMPIRAELAKEVRAIIRRLS